MAKKPTCEELGKRVKELEKDLVKSRHAEKALRASEKKYRTFFDKANDAVFIADVKTGVILDANKGAERLLGRSTRKIIGMHQSQLHPADQVKYYTEKFLNHVRNNRIVDCEAEILKKDGTHVPVCISAAVMELQGKKVIQGIFTDIAERKRADERVEEQLRFLQTLIDALPTPIFYKDKYGKYTGCNKAFEEFVGRPREKIIGKTVYDMGPNRIANKYYEKDQELFQNPGKQVYQWKVKRKSGELREVVFNKATFTDADGKVAGLIGGISDITERMQAQEQLRVYADELERINEELKQFVYIVSHDLQEPLATMSGYMNMLARRYTGKLDSDADRWINYVATESNRVQRLSGTLLKRALVSPSGKKVEPIDFEAVFDRTLVSLETVIADSGAQVTHDPLPTVMADELQMEEVFQNLIRNALKFRSTAAPRIHVSAQRNETEWVFSVQDNGLGIDPELTKRIFSLFHRIPTQGEYRGAGIGLAICRKILENHGGRIWVESELGKGAVFYFTIPATD